MGSRINFFKQYISNPGSIGAVAPSGKILASLMLDGISLDQASTVVELGPGTGVITSEIQKRISSKVRFMAIEKNPSFVNDLNQRLDQVEIIEGDATHLTRLLESRQLDQVDVVISGLPWAAFDGSIQDSILSEVASALAPEGRFVTFAYGGIHLFPKARAFRQRLGKYFGKIERTQLAWRNLPPAFAYHCSK